MRVELLWFECANPNCGYIPMKTKKEKVKFAWSKGKSIQQEARPRIFLSYVRGEVGWRDTLTIYKCQYGDIVLYDSEDKQHANSQYYPIKNKRICIPCTQRKQNEGLLGI